MSLVLPYVQSYIGYVYYCHSSHPPSGGLPLETLSYNATVVLQAMSRGHRYGFEIMKVADLPSGTVYRLLRRFERTGLAESRWEDVDPSDEGRPRRRYYRLTAEGERSLAGAVERLSARQALFGLAKGEG